MKVFFFASWVALIAIVSVPNSQAQNIYRLQPLSTFGTHHDGSVRPGDAVFDNAFNERGMAYDPVLTNVVVVDTHTGAGASDHGVGHIYVLDGLTGSTLDDGSGGNFALNTNGMPTVGPNQLYPYAPAGVADDGVVYVCNQVGNSTNTPFIIYRWSNSTNTDPPVMAYSNNIVPTQRYGTSMDIRGSGPNTQIIIGSLASGSTGTNVVIFTTTDGTNFVSNVLGADVTNPNFNDGIAFGPGNTFFAKQVGTPALRFMAFNLATHAATTIKAYDASTFADNDSLGAIAVNTNLNLLAAIEERGGSVSGGPERVRLYDISAISNSAPALLDVVDFVPDNQNATAPMGYIDFSGTNVYAHAINNGMMAFGVALAPPPPPVLTTIPAATNLAVTGQTINLTVAGFPAVHYQWQSNSVDIAGATSGTLTLVNVKTNYAATYTCVVTNSSGMTNASSQLVIVSSANYYHLNLQWTAYPGDGHDADTHAYIQNGNGASGGTPNARSVAYNPDLDHVYTITRAGVGASLSNYVFSVIDGSTGDLLYTLKTNGIQSNVGNGGIGLAFVAVADDGAIYAANITPNSGGLTNGVLDPTAVFRVYRWANDDSNTVPVQIYQGDPAINAVVAGPGTVIRWGDALAVRGSGINTRLLLDGPNVGSARYVAILSPTDASMLNWTQTVVHQELLGSSIGRSLEFGTGNTFWQRRNLTALVQSFYDQDPTGVNVKSTAFTNALSGAAIDNTRHLLAGVACYTTSPTPDTLNLYQIGDLNNPLLLAQYNFPVNSGTNHVVATPNCINQTIIRGDKLFTIEGGNGLMAFTIAAGAPTAPNFLVQPRDIRIVQGQAGSFTAIVDQQSVFQWRFNGVDIPGGTAATYSIQNAQMTNGGQYRVVASNIFGISTSAVATATIILSQDEYSFSPLWSVAPTNGNGNLVNANGGGTPNQRTIAYNALSNHLYVVSRLNPGSSSNYAVYVLDASTGALLSTLNTNGLYNAGAVGDGGVGLVGIGVSDDGSIYACNVAPDACGCGPSTSTNPPADSLFRVYRWAGEDTNSGPSLVFSGDPAGQATPLRWGDTLSVRGSGINTEILLDSQPSGFAAILKPADSALTSFTNQFFANAVPGVSLGRSLQFGPTNSFWQKRQGTGLQLSTYNAAANTSSVVTNFSFFPNTVGPCVIDLSRHLIAGIDFKGSVSFPDVLDLYDLSNPSQPLVLAQKSFPTNQQSNPNFIGQAVFAGNRVWALDANNGLIAFTINAPGLSVAQSGNTVTVSWTTNVAGLNLQSATSVTGAYSNATNAISIVNDRYTATDAASALTKFFRLQN